MDQSPPVVDLVLLSSVDVTRPVPRRFELGMSEFVRSGAFENENRGSRGESRFPYRRDPGNMILIL